MIPWLLSAFLVALGCVLLHALSVRFMNPLAPRMSLKRFRQFLAVRLIVLGVYLWQLVQQNLVVILFSMAFFIITYWAALLLVVRYKQHWLQLKDTKDQTLWML